MDTVLILIASPQAGGLDASLVSRATASLSIKAQPDWLSEGEACELAFTADEGSDPVAAENTVRSALGDAPVDVAVLPAAGRKKQLLVADMDSTIIGQECIDELAAIAGVGEKVSEITARAMAGELNFEEALRERLALLKDQPEGIIAEVIKTRITITPGARQLVQTMKANGALTGLISGGFTHFTGYVAKMCGFDEHQANTLDIADGKLTGRPVEPILGQKAKLRAIGQLTMMNGLSFSRTMAVGDGANDIPMLQRAGMGVAFRAKPVVRKSARIRIDHGDLTALLYLQGYRRDEFTTNATPHSVKITTS